MKTIDEKKVLIKEIAIQLFGHSQTVCSKCQQSAWYVYDMRGNPTTMTRCKTKGCPCPSVTHQKGWAEYLHEIANEDLLKR